MNHNILFWIDNELLPFVVSNFLQKKLTGNFFAIIDTVDRTKVFFEKQTIVKYKQTWFYHDFISRKNDVDIEYLKIFEEKYDINLWLLALNERLFYGFNEFYQFSHDEILAILEQECKLFEKIIQESNPEFLIIKTVDLHQNFLFSEICRKRGIKIILLEVSRFGKSILTQKLDAIDYSKPLIQYEHKRTDLELKSYLENNNRSKILREYRKHYISSTKKRINAALNFFLYSSNTNQKTHFSYYGRSKLKVFLRYIQYPIIEKYRQNFIDHKLVNTLNSKYPFIFYPLHEEPERTLLLGAPFYTNQIEIIRHIAKSLPVGYLLFVKEHPSQVIRGWRKTSFYKEIMNIPNVVLLHPSLTFSDLLQKSSLVVSISGTAILEAAFYEKPSIVFAETVFSNLSFVEKVSSIPELPIIIKKSLMKKVDLTELDRFITMYESNSFDFDYIWFQKECFERFFYGGHLADVEVSEEDMKSFLKQHELVFDNLANEYLKKIKQHDEYQSAHKIN